MRKRIEEEIKVQHLPKKDIQIFSKEEISFTDLVSDYPHLYTILNDISNEFNISGNCMLMYLQQKKVNHLFHIDDDIQQYAKARQLTKIYNLDEFLNELDMMHTLEEPDLSLLQPVFQHVCQIINKDI